jgi:hypothetical protein
MKLDHLLSGVAGLERNECVTPEAWLERRKRFLEDVRLRGGQGEHSGLSA